MSARDLCRMTDGSHKPQRLRITLLALLCLLVAAGQSSFAQSPTTAPLIMQEAVDYALAHNPALLAARQNLLSMKGQEVEAGLRQNPDLDLAGNAVTLGPSNPEGPYLFSAGVSRLFERGQKRRWRLDTAHATTAETAAQLHDQERQITLAVRQAFTNLMLAKAALQLARDTLKDYKHQLDISHDRYQAGDIGKIDYERLDLQLAQFETDESVAEMNLGQASVQMQTLLGYDRPLQSFDIAGDLIPPPVTYSLNDLEQKALAGRPDYQAAHAAVNVADANVKLAYANGTTDPTLEGEYDRSGTANTFGFSVSIPMRIFDRNQGNKDTTRYLAQGSRFAEVEARNQVYSDVDQAWIAYTASRAVSDRYNGHYLEEAHDVLSIAEFAYQRGGISLLDYLSAVQDSRTIGLNALNASAQTWMAIHQLSFASATDIAP